MNKIRQYRGKRVDNNEWIYGYFVYRKGGTNKTGHIFSSQFLIYDVDFGDVFSVIPETVGQFTGLKDKDGVDIYEGDILSLNGEENFKTTCCGEIVSYKGMYCSFYGCDLLHRDCFDELYTVCNQREIIGNATDNPELLKD